MILIRRLWKQQPQQPTGIDWGNQLTRGLHSVVRWDRRTADLLGRSAASIVVPANATKAFVDIGVGVASTSNALNISLYHGNSSVNQGATFSTETTTLAIFRQFPIPGVGASAVLQHNFASNTSVNVAMTQSSSVDHRYAVGGSALVTLGYSPKMFTLTKTSNGDAWGAALWNDFGAKVVSQTGTSTAFGARFQASTTTNQGIKALLLSAIWERVLSDYELASIAYNPWQIFAPRRIIIPTADAAPAYPTLSDLTYTPASITATGWRPRYTITY
jgi:hypothetical protein